MYRFPHTIHHGSVRRIRIHRCSRSSYGQSNEAYESIRVGRCERMDEEKVHGAMYGRPRVVSRVKRVEEEFGVHTQGEGSENVLREMLFHEIVSA